MGFWDSLFGVQGDDRPRDGAPRRGRRPTEDEYAVDRYRYLLRTAPPDQVERVHAEAFARLTPAQRQLLHDELAAAVDEPGEAPADAEPDTLARSAVRAEYRQPGTMERVLGGQSFGPSFGSMFASSMLGSIAGYVVGSAIMSMFLPPVGMDEFYQDGYADGYADGGAGDGGSSGDAIAAGDYSGDYGGGLDSGAGDGGFDGGDFGGGFDF